MFLRFRFFYLGGFRDLTQFNIFSYIVLSLKDTLSVERWKIIF